MNMQKNHSKKSISQTVEQLIELNGERFWRLTDFEGLSFSAVAQALSRLTRKGKIQRLGKGLYYRSRLTAFGESKPNISKLRSLPIYGKGIFPAGTTAANLLGFTTQNPARIEIATNGSSLPRLLMGEKTIIHTRRPESWKHLTIEDGAILDFIREGGKSSELSPEKTVEKLLQYFSWEKYETLFQISDSEPPRARAILGAIGQQIGYSELKLSNLRKTLNSLSRFDFGNLRPLQHAKQWQSKGSNKS